MNEWIIFAIAGGAATILISVLAWFSFRKKKGNRTCIATSNVMESIPPSRPLKSKTERELASISPGSMRQSQSSLTSGPRRYKKICLVCNREYPEDFTGKCQEDGVELSKIADNFAPGSRFSEYYEIISPLGKGGLSKVYLAKHLSSGREVAIKLLHSHLCTDKASVQRFQREANALSKLSHPNLVSVEDFMISPDGIPFIVMEYLEGESLQQILKREGNLSWQKTVSMFIQICKGLSHAHSRNIIHRDLKPGNVMLVPQNGEIVVKVVDFGLVKANDVDSMGRLTSTGEVFGSPMYMSPEQCQGKDVDRRSDVYSLGCLLYECLTGSPPFVGKNVIDTLTLHLKAPIPALSQELELPPWLVETLQKALQKEPEQRHQSIDDFGGALQDGLAYGRTH